MVSNEKHQKHERRLNIRYALKRNEHEICTLTLCLWMAALADAAITGRKRRGSSLSLCLGGVAWHPYRAQRPGPRHLSFRGIPSLEMQLEHLQLGLWDWGGFLFVCEAKVVCCWANRRVARSWRGKEEGDEDERVSIINIMNWWIAESARRRRRFEWKCSKKKEVGAGFYGEVETKSKWTASKIFALLALVTVLWDGTNCWEGAGRNEYRCGTWFASRLAFLWLKFVLGPSNSRLK